MKAAIRYGVFALLILVIGVLVYLLTLDLNHYKPILIETVSRQTGRELRIEGDLTLSPSLTPIISVQGLSLANAPWSASGDPMLSVGSAEAQVSLLALLTGRIDIRRISLLDTNIALETDAAGVGNWTLMPATDADSRASVPAGSPAPFSVAELTVRNVRMSYLDGITAARYQFAVNELSASLSDEDSPISFDLDADYNNLPVRLGGSLGGIAGLLADSPYLLDIRGRIGPVEVSANGRIEKPSMLTGGNIELAARLERLSDLNELAGTNLPPIQPAGLNTRLMLDGLDEMRLEELSLQLGTSLLTGKITYRSTETRPAISMDMHSGEVDLRPFAGQPVQAPTPAYLFSREPLPLSVLSMVDLEATLAAETVRYKNTVLNNTGIEAHLADGALQSVIKTGLAGGTLSGRLGLSPQVEGSPALTIELSGNAIELGQLPHDEQKPWFVGGPVTLQVSGTSQGNSVAELMGSYNGKLLVEVGAATMPNANVNLFGADILMSVFNQLNPLARDESSSTLECAVIHLDIRDGLARIDRQIALQTSRMSMVGSGEINFRTEELNLGFKPYAREGIGVNLGNLAGAARIGGTLANRKIEIDTKGALKAGATAGAAVATGGLSLLAQGLFSRTREDREPCRTALGSQVTPPESAASETTVKDEPQEEEKGVLDQVGGGLKRLFGR